jgi:hypothetical protein
MRFFLTIALLAAFPLAVWASDAPPGQAHIGANDVLRGHFVEERQIKEMAAPMQSTGHFIVAPGHGLIWGIEQPFPTSTIITPNGLVQDVGGIALKVPAKHLRHLYEMVGGALAGDWSGLDNDFILTRSGDSHHWQMLLTPRPDKASLPYASITVSGSRFVEHIAMLKGDGSADTLSFSDTVLSQGTLSPVENAAFNEVKP